jgi:hypothetical protein
MNFKVLGGPLDVESEAFKKLNNFCLEHNFISTIEWIDGQYWLHSDNNKERPIGVQIDKELDRHLDFFKRSSIINELLARSIGVKSGFRPKILDLTGGLLGDTLLFLSFGCEVITLERHPIISFLLKSSLQNAKHPALSRLTFLPMDALNYLNEKPKVDVIFFDPMFEDVNERALPRKEMRIFREFVGSDKDALEVFRQARIHLPKRLVVKRSRHSVPLVEGPQITYQGKATRYDVYLS